MDGKEKCACGDNANHWSSREPRLQCCFCYVRAGNPPSDWHPDCMKHFKNRERDRELASDLAWLIAHDEYDL